MFKKKIVNILHLEGVISSKGKKNISFKNLHQKIDKAFEGKGIKAVALLVNSPGGSASQSEIIANYIKDKSEQTKIPVIAFVEDVAASGGYFIACAASEIYALSKSSIVGSIGVIYSSFGLSDFIKKHGVQRRVHTAGESKSILDPFVEEKEEDIKILNQLLAETHENFKDFIKENRKKITMEEKELFSGKFWLANTAVKFGIIDGIIVNFKNFLQERYGKKVKINFPKTKKSFLGSLFGVKINIDDDLVNTLVTSLENNGEIKAKVN